MHSLIKQTTHTSNQVWYSRRNSLNLYATAANEDYEEEYEEVKEGERDTLVERFTRSWYTNRRKHLEVKVKSVSSIFLLFIKASHFLGPDIAEG